MRKDHSHELGVDGRITSKLILRKYDKRTGTGYMQFRMGVSGLAPAETAKKSRFHKIQGTS